MDHTPATAGSEPVIARQGFEAARPVRAQWHVLWTRSHCEQLVHDQLMAKGYTLFLPMLDVWIRHKGHRQHVSAPMFPGYLFLHHAMDKASYLDVTRAQGLAKVLGERWDRLATVPEGQIASLQRVHQAHLPTLIHPYLREGERVRITGGLLAGAEGILLRKELNKGLLVVSIDLLQRSVAVEMDCTLVEAA